jgi:hypothetical protein
VATPDTASAKDAKPTVSGEDSWYYDLSPENRVAYRQAKLARAQAEAVYEEAKRAAEDEAGKPGREFNKAKQAYHAAKTKLTEKVGQAQEKLMTLSELAKGSNAKVLVEPKRPDEAADQLAKLQLALDDYKACAAAVAAQVQAVEEAKLALRKVSDPEKFDADDPKPNKTAERLAQEQKELALAQAQIPLDAALDAYELKKAELEGSKPRKKSELEGSRARVLQ